MRVRHRRRNSRKPGISSRATAAIRRAARRGRRCARRCLPARNSAIASDAQEDISVDPLMNTFSRRSALKSAVAGFGYLAFAGLSSWAAEKDKPQSARKPHFPARAKRVIFLCMEGAPSHVDTFDYK